MASAGNAPFTGAVLTGGASTRMGADKAFVELDGRPLVAIAAEALVGAGAREVLTIGGDVTRLRGLGLDLDVDLTVRPDDHPGEGPLGGVITALRAASHEIVVVLACDMPRIDATTVETLVTALAQAPDAMVAAPVLADAPGHRPQALTAAYRRAALDVLVIAFEAGERAVRPAVGRLPLVEVVVADPERLADVDRPSDLARYAQRRARPRG